MGLDVAGKLTSTTHAMPPFRTYVNLALSLPSLSTAFLSPSSYFEASLDAKRWQLRSGSLASRRWRRSIRANGDRRHLVLPPCIPRRTSFSVGAVSSGEDVLDDDNALERVQQSGSDRLGIPKKSQIGQDDLGSDFEDLDKLLGLSEERADDHFTPSSTADALGNLDDLVQRSTSSTSTIEDLSAEDDDGFGALDDLLGLDGIKREIKGPGKIHSAKEVGDHVDPERATSESSVHAGTEGLATSGTVNNLDNLIQSSTTAPVSEARHASPDYEPRHTFSPSPFATGEFTSSKQDSPFTTDVGQIDQANDLLDVSISSRAKNGPVSDLGPDTARTAPDFPELDQSAGLEALFDEMLLEEKENDQMRRSSSRGGSTVDGRHHVSKRGRSSYNTQGNRPTYADKRSPAMQERQSPRALPRQSPMGRRSNDNDYVSDRRSGDRMRTETGSRNKQSRPRYGSRGRDAGDGYGYGYDKVRGIYQANDDFDSMWSPAEKAQHALVRDLDALGARGAWQDAVRALVGAKIRKVPLTQTIYNRAVAAVSESGRFKEAFSMMDQMREDGLAPNVHTYQAAIDACRLARESKKAVDVLKDMKSAGVLPDAKCFSIVIEACAEGGSPAEALKVVKAMKAEGFAADTEAYNALIRAHARHGQWEKAIETMDDMREEGLEPDLYSYELAMQACGNGRKWERALLLLDNMAEDGLSPDVSSYRVAIETLAKAGQLQKIFDVLEEMDELGEDPDMACFEHATMACAKSGRWREANDLLNRMRLVNLQPDLEIYKHALRACVKGKACDRALCLSRDLQRAGGVHDDDSWRLVVEACIAAERWECAVSVLADMCAGEMWYELDDIAGMFYNCPIEEHRLEALSLIVTFQEDADRKKRRKKRIMVDAKKRSEATARQKRFREKQRAATEIFEP